MTQSNLGIALAMLGGSENDPALLRLAVQAYDNALLEYTGERSPSSYEQVKNYREQALQQLRGEEPTLP